MNLCSICQLPVLELAGQFEMLQPYDHPHDVESDHPALELAGECHAACIATHEYGSAWYKWRVQSFLAGRGYRIAGEPEGWCVLIHTRHPRMMAFHASGFSVARKPPNAQDRERRVEGGVLVRVEEETNLECDDIEVIRTIKSGLEQEGTYKILALLDALGVADRVKWPLALENADFLLDKKLQEHWASTWVSMRTHYDQFLPEAIVPYWKSLK